MRPRAREIASVATSLRNPNLSGVGAQSQCASHSEHFGQYDTSHSQGERDCPRRRSQQEQRVMGGVYPDRIVVATSTFPEGTSEAPPSLENLAFFGLRFGLEVA